VIGNLMKNLLMGLVCIIIVGCATPTNNLSRISLGMSKVDVVNAMGSPSSVSAKDNVEYLKYNFAPTIMGVEDSSRNYDYFVRLINGKVESYGKVGDFDSAKNPAVDINANVNSGSK